MSFQEKRSIVYAISTILITLVYFAIALQSYPSVDEFSPTVYQYWGKTILILIPVSIVAKIVIHIIFSVLNTIATHEEEPSFTDELDKLVVLKSNRNGFYVFSIGFILAMISVATEMPPAVMFSILITAGMLSDVVSELFQLYYYRRGV